MLLLVPTTFSQFPRAASDLTRPPRFDKSEHIENCGQSDSRYDSAPGSGAETPPTGGRKRSATDYLIASYLSGQTDGEARMSAYRPPCRSSSLQKEEDIVWPPFGKRKNTHCLAGISRLGYPYRARIIQKIKGSRRIAKRSFLAATRNGIRRLLGAPITVGNPQNNAQLPVNHPLRTRPSECRGHGQRDDLRADRRETNHWELLLSH